MDRGETIFSDFLRLLGVPYTGAAADAAFRNMNFQSLFGFARLLNSYGVETRGVRINDKKTLSLIPVPFLAHQKNGFVIVTGFSNDASGARAVDYIYYHQSKSQPLDAFTADWDGVTLLAYPTEKSREPDYARNHFYEIAEVVKKWLMILCAAFVGIFGFIEAGLWRNLSTIFLTLVDFAGIGVTWLLILKSLKVASKSADRICGVLQKHGCDHVLEQKASKFFGLFGWSEVGISYFTVSTLILFIFPGQINHLALINACCLPFTVWSIWYQKFRIKTWCTLCVTTQCLLWLQFFCYFFGGCWHDIFPLRLPLFVMGAAYVATLMAVNRVMTFIEKRSPK